MATSTLFGYSVEEQDGRLVITMHGEVAEAALRALREQIKIGGRSPLLTMLSPLRPFRQLMSAQVVLGQGAVDPEIAAGGDDLSSFTSQAVDQSLTTFREQMADFRHAIEELRSGVSNTASAKQPPAAPAPPSSPPAKKT